MQYLLTEVKNVYPNSKQWIGGANKGKNIFRSLYFRIFVKTSKCEIIEYKLSAYFVLLFQECFCKDSSMKVFSVIFVIVVPEIFSN